MYFYRLSFNVLDQAIDAKCSNVIQHLKDQMSHIMKKYTAIISADKYV